MKKGYAAQITTEWFRETETAQYAIKGRKVLDKTLTYEPVNEEGKIDTTLLRVQTDVSKAYNIYSRKEEGYQQEVNTQERTENL